MIQTTACSRSALAPTTSARRRRWTLEQLICSRRISAGVSVLGMAEDNLPCLLDLHDQERIGSLLFIGQRSSTTDILKSMAYSTQSGSSQSGVIIITDQPHKWTLLSRMIIHDNDAPLQWLINIIENRGDDRREILLLVDSASLIADWATFQWICEHGPAVCVWPALAAEKILDVNAPEFFRFKIAEIAGGEYRMSDGNAWVRFAPLLF